MVNKNVKPWCAEPFTTLESKVWGNWGLCCRSKPLDYHAKDVSPLEHFNSDTMKRIRKDMSNHNITDEIRNLCSKCIEHEKNGVESRRMGMMRVPTPNIQDDGKLVNFRFRALEIKFFGNLCNLKCRMCGPLYSSSIAAEQRISGQWDGDVHHDTWKQYTSDQRTKFFEDMNVILPHTNELKFTGGEPMMNSSILDFIKWVVDNNLSSNLVLRIITNGTKLNDQLLDLSKQFKEFVAVVSVDGIYDIDEYQRTGTNFEDVDGNIDILKQYATVGLATAVTAINVSTLYQIQMYADSKQISTNFSSIVSFPDYLQVKVLPVEYRMSLLNRHSYHPVVESALKDPEWPVDLWNKFIDVNPKITELVPELIQYVGNRF